MFCIALDFVLARRGGWRYFLSYYSLIRTASNGFQFLFSFTTFDIKVLAQSSTSMNMAWHELVWFESKDMTRMGVVFIRRMAWIG